MIKKTLIILLTFISTTSAQNQNSVWCFGDSSGINFTNVLSPISIQTGVVSRGSCASIADSLGSLLFYAFNKAGVNDSATLVFNYSHDTMQNGYNLNGQFEYNQIIIISNPTNPNEYYIFHNGIYSTQGLYFSLVDMTFNGGLGEVVQKNVPLISNTRMGDCNQAIKHGNGRDWWVITKLSGPGNTQINRFFVYLISPSGISNPIIQDFGNATDGDLQKLVFNNQANKLMNVNVLGLMTEYDFDRCTGIISNPNIIFTEQTSNLTRLFDEGAYSPNDSLYYVATTWNSFPNDTSRLLQFNLFAPNIPASCDTLFEIRSPVITGAVRLAPDNKIYYTCLYQWGFPGYPYPDSVYNQYNMNLSVVNSPDNIGVSCNFQPFSFYLGGKRTYFGLPNNPNYELGPLYGSPCDSLSSGVNELVIKNNAALFVFYHNAWQKLFVNAKALNGKKYKLNVFDVAGKLVFKEEGKLSSGYFTKDLNCAAFAKGIYIVDFKTEKEILVQKFVKE